MERRLAAILCADMFGYSRLVEANEQGVLDRQKAHRRELIDPEIERNRGRIVKTTGDGLLAEFDTANDAVRCAIDIQAAMGQREPASLKDQRIQYRIGINVGDLVFDDGDVFGDAVNIASRIESLGEPGSVCVSDLVHQIIRDRMHEPFRDLGLQRVKNITRPIRIWQWSPDADYENAGEVAEKALSQSVQFCSSADGTLLAYAKIGAGAPVLKAPNWLGHLEYEWQSPVWEPWIRELARNYELTRFDQRGSGLSDWDVAEISEDAMQADMRAVADAAGLERFALIGISQGCPFSIRYAAENPDRVKCLVLLGGFAAGRLQTGTKDDESVYQASLMMIEQGWGSPNPAYRHFFTSSLIADASPEEAKSFDELQRLSSSPQNAMRITEMNAKVRCPRPGPADKGSDPCVAHPRRPAGSGGARPAHGGSYPRRALCHAGGQQPHPAEGRRGFRRILRCGAPIPEGTRVGHSRPLNPPPARTPGRLRSPPRGSPLGTEYARRRGAGRILVRSPGSLCGSARRGICLRRTGNPIPGA